MNNCLNCAWYCHSDSHCYGSRTALQYGPNPLSIVRKDERRKCSCWQFDGLDDRERKELGYEED